MLPDRRGGFLAGLIAGAAATLTMLLLRLVLDAPSIAELLADRITFVVPLPLFTAVVELLGGAAKRLFFVAVLLGMVAVGGVLGAAAARRRLDARGGLRWLGALWLLSAFLLLPSLGVGPFGVATRHGPVVATLALGLLWAVYGGVLYAMGLLLRRAAAMPSNAGRRRALRLAGLGGAVALAGGVGLWQLVERLTSSAASAALGRGDGRLPPEVTPVGQFYSISKNFFGDPNVDAASWRLEIGGDVAHPYTLGYDELRALPAVEDYRTLLCISNEVGGDLIGNAQWRGVRLRDLLARAEPAPESFKVIFHCADDYSDSIRFTRAMEPDTLLVYEMNGAPLIPKHGYPARLLVPDIYGMKNVKWVRRVEVTRGDYRGFWQQRGWSEEAIIKTMSRLDTVGRFNTVATEPVLLGGIAFAGARGVQRVEYSVDDGHTWQPAQLKAPLGPYAWVLWTAEWTPPRAGEYIVKVRAIDGLGGPQTARIAEPLPDGASGLHTAFIRALDG